MDVFQAVAEPNRRKVIDLLARRERSVQDLVAHFDVSFQAISQHLKVLDQVGLVAKRKQGRYRMYRLKPRRLKQISDWVKKYEAFWNERLDRLGEVLDEQS